MTLAPADELYITAVPRDKSHKAFAELPRRKSEKLAAPQRKAAARTHGSPSAAGVAACGRSKNLTQKRTRFFPSIYIYYHLQERTQYMTLAADEKVPVHSEP